MTYVRSHCRLIVPFLWTIFVQTHSWMNRIIGKESFSWQGHIQHFQFMNCDNAFSWLLIQFCYVEISKIKYTRTADVWINEFRNRLNMQKMNNISKLSTILANCLQTIRYWVFFFTGPPPEKLKYGKPRLGEVTCI